MNAPTGRPANDNKAHPARLAEALVLFVLRLCALSLYGLIPIVCLVVIGGWACVVLSWIARAVSGLSWVTS